MGQGPAGAEEPGPDFLWGDWLGYLEGAQVLEEGSQTGSGMCHGSRNLAASDANPAFGLHQKGKVLVHITGGLQAWLNQGS